MADYVLASAIEHCFRDKDTGEPLAGGYVHFRNDNDRVSSKVVYKQSGLPGTYTFVPYETNADGSIPLNAYGTFDHALYYYPYDDDGNIELYYVKVYSNAGLDQAQDRDGYPYVPPAANTDKNTGNIFVNGQFDLPQVFSIDKENPNQIQNASTTVAWGWTFLQDNASTTKNIITFNPLISESLDGNPAQEIQLDSSDIMANESQKSLNQTIGFITAYEGETITLSILAQNKLTGTVPVELFLYKNYGVGGSSEEYIPIKTFTVGTARTKYTTVYTMPSNSGKSQGDGAFIGIKIQIGLAQICKVGITNVLGINGNVANPLYLEYPYGEVLAKTMAKGFSFSAGIENNYHPIKIIDGSLQTQSDTGAIIQYTKGKEPANALQCDGATLKVSDYTIKNIPNRRLFDVIGTSYGTSGDLIVTNSANVLSFESSEGGRVFSAYDSGTLGAKFPIAEVSKGLDAGVLVTSTPTTATLTCVDTFTPSPTPGPIPHDPQYGPPAGQPPSGWVGNWYETTVPVDPPVTYSATPPIHNPFTISVTQAGPTPAAEATITFNDTVIEHYKSVSTVINDSQGPQQENVYVSNFLEWSSVGLATRAQPYSLINEQATGIVSPAIQVYFGVDSAFGPQLPVSAVANSLFNVNFLSSNTLAQNIQIFAKTLNTPFKYNGTFNGVPVAAEYFKYSSITVSYYCWYRVDGAGVDPAPAGGGTGVVVDIASTDTTTEVATKTQAQIDSLTFDLPLSGTNVSAVPGSVADNYIYA